MRPLHRSFVTIATLTLGVGSTVTLSLPVAAAPDVATCFGRTATVVTNHDYTGTSGADVIVETGNYAHVDGKGGNDRICVRGNYGSFQGGSGNDRISSSARPKKTGEAFGGPGDDLLRGVSARYDDAPRGVTIDLHAGSARGYGHDRLVQVVDAVGSPYADVIRGSGADNQLSGGDGDDTVLGRDGADVLWGDAGADTVSGDAGSDLVFPQRGNDQLAGGAGKDAVDFGQAPGAQGVTIDLAKGTATGAGRVHLSGFERVIGSGGPDVINGSAGRDVIYPDEGDDVIRSRGGNDAVFADYGKDTVYAGAGNDHVEGGPSHDRIAGGPGDDYLDGDGFESESAPYVDTTGNRVSGGAGDDVLKGDNGPDTLLGGPGLHDYANGLGGHDTCRAERRKNCP